MILRRFNTKGIETFRKCLDECRQNPGIDINEWDQLLEDSSLTEIVDKNIEIERRLFSTRREAAEYFVQIFAPLNTDSLREDFGLWDWLSLFYFDSVCPVKDHVRTVRSNYTYIIDVRRNQYIFHRIFIVWHIQTLSPEFNKLWLDRPIALRDGYSGTVFGRLRLTRIPCIYEVVHKLYWDESQNRPRPSITGGKSNMRQGDLTNRFPTCIDQLEMTYDLQVLSADQIIELLGDEFKPENIGKK